MNLYVWFFTTDVQFGSPLFNAERILPGNLRATFMMAALQAYPVYLSNVIFANAVGSIHFADFSANQPSALLKFQIRKTDAAQLLLMRQVFIRLLNRLY